MAGPHSGSVLALVNLDSALGAAERHVDDRAFIGHQRRERLHLFRVHVRRKANASFDRQLVMAVLGAPRFDHLESASVLPDRKVESVDAVAGLDLLEQTRRVFSARGCGVEASVDGFQEAAGGGHGLVSLR